MASFNPSGSGGLSPSVTVAGATTPVITVVTMPMAATEYTTTLPVDTKGFRIRLRSGKILQLAYTLGASGTTYEEIPAWCSLSVDGLLLTAPLNLYFQSPAASQIAEVIYWT